MANDKITGDGIAQLAQVANLARSLLAGPQEFAVRSITGKMIGEALEESQANLASIADLTAPISTLATIGKTLSISALAPLGPIAAVLGVITGLFRKKPRGPVIAHLPPHQVINLIHQKEAIHLFLKPAGQMEAEIQAMQRRGNLAVSCTQFFSKASNPLAQLPEFMINNAKAQMLGPGKVQGTQYAWAPGTDAGMAAAIKSLKGALIGGLRYSIIGRFGDSPRQGSPYIDRAASACVKGTFGSGRSFNKAVGWADTVSYVFDMEGFKQAVFNNPACANEPFSSFGLPYVCGWYSGWRGYNPHILRIFRAEIGEWMLKVAAHPLYRNLIQRMVDVELERNRRRASNARGAVALIGNPTVKTIREFTFLPIGPALLSVKPDTVASLESREKILIARTSAQDSVNIATAASMSISKDESLQTRLSALLEEVRASSAIAFSSSDANVVWKAAEKAHVTAKKADALVTPGITQVLEFIKDPKVFIPALLIAGFGLIASAEEGA